MIDAHVHVWDFEKAEYPWLAGNNTLLNRTYSLEELEPARLCAGVGSGLLVQAANNREDTEWMLAVAANHGWIEGVVGWLPLLDPAATAGILERDYTAEGLLKGVRHLIHDERDADWLLQDPVLESLGLLASRGIPYDVVGVTTGHLRTVLRVAHQWPSLQLVLDHLNQPPIAAPGMLKEWSDLMKAAAGHANIHVKISGLGTAAGKGMDWRPEDLELWVEFAVDQFGPDRCMCGGDWPVCLLAGSYEKTWAAYRGIISKYLGKEDQERLYGDNARRFYGLGSVK